MKEWRDVVGYEGLYKVSSEGEIISLNLYAHKEPRLLKLSKRPDGYLSVNLSKNGKAKSYTVHRIVANAFLINPNGYEVINHKDENRANNHVKNLEWCDKSYNQLYSIEKHPERKMVFARNFIDKKTGESTSSWTRKGIAHKRKEAVVQKDKDGNTIKMYENVSVAQMKTGIDAGNIYDTCKRNSKTGRKRKCTAKGYVWEYLK